MPVGTSAEGATFSSSQRKRFFFTYACFFLGVDFTDYVQISSLIRSHSCCSARLSSALLHHLALWRVFRIYILEQKTHTITTTTQRPTHQPRRNPLVLAQLRIVQCRVPLAVLQPDIGPALQQARHQRGMAAVDRPVQGRAALLVLRGVNESECLFSWLNATLYARNAHLCVDRDAAAFQQLDHLCVTIRFVF